MATKQKTSQSSGVDKINPSHYRRNSMSNTALEAVDVMEAFFQHDIHVAHAFKYMARAGHKKESSYVEDLMKARWWLERAIKQHGGHPNLDPKT